MTVISFNDLWRVINLKIDVSTYIKIIRYVYSERFKSKSSTGNLDSNFVFTNTNMTVFTHTLLLNVLYGACEMVIKEGYCLK